MASASKTLCVLLLTALAACQAMPARPLADELTLREEVQQELEQVTKLSNELFKLVVDDINDENYETNGSLVAPGLQNITVKFWKLNTRFAGLDVQHKLTPFGDADAKLVVESLTTFVKAHQAALDMAITKFKVLFPFYTSINRPLRLLDNSLKNFGFYLIRLIPTQETAGKEQIFKSLQEKLALALSYFEPYHIPVSPGSADH